MTHDPFFAAAVFPHMAARPAEGDVAHSPSAQVSEHRRLTAGTADLWRQLAAVDLRWGTP